MEPLALSCFKPLLRTMLPEEEIVVNNHDLPESMTRHIRRTYYTQMRDGKHRTTVCLMILGRLVEDSPIFLGVSHRHLKLDPVDKPEVGRRYAFGRAVGQLKDYLDFQSKMCRAKTSVSQLTKESTALRQAM